MYLTIIVKHPIRKTELSIQLIGIADIIVLFVLFGVVEDDVTLVRKIYSIDVLIFELVSVA